MRLKSLEVKQISPENMHVLVSEIVSYCLRLHDGFDAEVWKRNFSFHNSGHVQNVLLMAGKYIEYITEQIKNKVDNPDDPLNLIASLSSWNSLHNTSFNLEDIDALVKIAIAFHDVGNIACLKKDEEGYSIEYLEKYTSSDAEARSAGIAAQYLAEHGFTAEQIALVNHLISQTTFNSKNIQDNFALFMRVVDQLGGNVLGVKNSTDFQENIRSNEQGVLEIKKRVLGLLMEMVAEGKEDITVDPYRFLNFFKCRGEELLGNLVAVELLIRNLSLIVADEIIVNWGILTVGEFQKILERELSGN